MRSTVSEKVQVKAASGVRDLDELIKVRDLGGSRCGVSGKLVDVAAKVTDHGTPERHSMAFVIWMESYYTDHP
jgi:deoxyribose-phosphate aldolase